MQFGTGFSGSVVSGLYSPNSTGSASAPAGTSGPTGSPSVVAAAWGAQNDGQSPAGQIASLVGLAAWVGLIVWWWALPR